MQYIYFKLHEVYDIQEFKTSRIKNIRLDRKNKSFIEESVAIILSLGVPSVAQN